MVSEQYPSNLKPTTERSAMQWTISVVVTYMHISVVAQQ
jgi:hypothetical protein